MLCHTHHETIKSSLRWMTSYGQTMGPVAGPEISQLAWLVWQQSPINMEAGEITSERRLSSRERERERGAAPLRRET